VSTEGLLSGWAFDPPVVVGIMVATLLYALGRRYQQGRPRRPWQPAAFGAGLLVIWLALQSPIEGWVDRLLWVHMLQHELLAVVAAPLLLLAGPLMPLWRALPRSVRRWGVRQTWLRRGWHSIAALLRSPVVVWLLFLGGLTLWHLPPLYDLALAQETVHDFEHLLFLATALLFWAQVIPTAPLRPRLTYRGQALFVASAGLALHLLDFVFILAASPLYPFYAAIQRTPSLPSVLADQSMAGGVMELLNMSIFAVAFALVLRRSWAPPDGNARWRVVLKEA